VAPVQSNFDHCKGATQAAAGGGKGACKCPDTTSSYLACNCTTEARSHNVSCFTKTNAWKCTVDGGSCTSAVESGCTLTGQVEICTKESKNNKDETEWKLGVLTADAINSQCGSLVTCTLPAKKPPAAAGNTDSTNEASTATTTSPKPTGTCRSVGNHDVMLTCVVLRYLVLTTVRDCVGKTHGGTQARNHGGVYLHLHRTLSTDL